MHDLNAIQPEHVIHNKGGPIDDDKTSKENQMREKRSEWQDILKRKKEPFKGYNKRFTQRLVD